MAERAGVSRQLVGAVEVGRHAPNVLAALSIAGALGTTVEDLFRPNEPTVLPIVGDAFPADGAPSVVARVGDLTVVAPVEHGVENPERWALADATVADGILTVFPDARNDGVVVAGCDPALGVLASLTERVSAHRVVTVHASTGRSTEALRLGRVHAIVVHALANDLPTPPVPVRRYHLARWQVGVASGRSHGVPSLEEISERRLRVVQRDAGAGTQQAFARALHRIGTLTPIPGPVGEGHVDVARRVAAGAVAGLTMEAAARSFGLSFEPLEEHVVEVWIDERWAGLPAATALLDVLNRESFQSRLTALGGYDLRDCGTERRSA